MTAHRSPTTPAKDHASSAKSDIPRDGAERRRRAEQRLREQQAETAQVQTAADTQRLVHELQVHQIELEMQNEELQQARHAMEAEREKYGDLYDFAPVGYLTLDREGTIQEANLTVASLLGIDRGRLRKRRLGAHVAEADRPRLNAFLQKVSASADREFCEVTFLKDDGLPVAVQIAAALAASGEELRVTVTDITERNRAEQDRLVLSKLESTGILAGGIAHDFNNLLTVILLDLEQVRTLAPPGEGLARVLDDAMKSTWAARGLTQQLITFSKGGAPVRKPTRLADVIHDSVHVALSGSRVRGGFSLADDLWLAEVDGGQIGQVIRNLVLNGREAMPEGGVIAIRAENLVLKSGDHPSLSAGDYIRLSIADQGGGIAKDVLPKIFDPYFSTKRRGAEKGTGLGLSICHAVIQKHAGAIVVRSEVGVGTTVEIHLPASRRLLQAERAPVKISAAAIARQHARILVMDDEDGMRRVLDVTLRRMGHEVELVDDGQSAIAVYSSARRQGHPFDLVILDLTVRAGLGGQEAMQALLKADPAVKAIVMSGYTSDPAVLEPERFGFKGVLPKPFDGKKMGEIVARVLGLGSSDESSVTSHQ